MLNDFCIGTIMQTSCCYSLHFRIHHSTHQSSTTNRRKQIRKRSAKQDRICGNTQKQCYRILEYFSVGPSNWKTRRSEDLYCWIEQSIFSRFLLFPLVYRFFLFFFAFLLVFLSCRTLSMYFQQSSDAWKNKEPHWTKSNNKLSKTNS